MRQQPLEPGHPSDGLQTRFRLTSGLGKLDQLRPGRPNIYTLTLDDCGAQGHASSPRTVLYMTLMPLQLPPENRGNLLQEVPESFASLRGKGSRK